MKEVHDMVNQFANLNLQTFPYTRNNNTQPSVRHFI